MNIRDLKDKFANLTELVFSFILFFAIAIFGYGANKGLLFIAEWVAVISDALIIILARVLIFRKRYAEKTIKRSRLFLPVFAGLSVILHSITFYFSGWQSFELIFPMIVFLITIYLIQKIWIFMNR
jgi:hypothetical protein